MTRSILFTTKLLVLCAVFLSAVSAQWVNVTGNEPAFAWPKKSDNEVNIPKDQFGTFGEMRYLISAEDWILHTSDGSIVEHPEDIYKSNPHGWGVKFIQMTFGGKEYWILSYGSTVEIWSLSESKMRKFTVKPLSSEHYVNLYNSSAHAFAFGKYLFAGSKVVYDMQKTLIVGGMHPDKYGDVEGLSADRKKWIQENCFQHDFACAPYLNGTVYPAESEGIGRGKANETVVLFFGSGKMFVRCGDVQVHENLYCHYYIDDGNMTTYFFPKDLIPENFDRTKEVRTMLWPFIRSTDSFIAPYLTPEKTSHLFIAIVFGCAIFAVVLLILVVVGGIAWYLRRYRQAQSNNAVDVTMRLNDLQELERRRNAEEGTLLVITTQTAGRTGDEAASTSTTQIAGEGTPLASTEQTAGGEGTPLVSDTKIAEENEP